MRLITPCFIVTIVLAIALACVSCGGGTAPTPVQPDFGLDLPWPPPEGVIKLTSDEDTFVLTGHDSDVIGGDAMEVGFPPNALRLADGGVYSWGIFSLGGFSDTIAFSKLTFNYDFVPAGPDDNSKLYLGFANYSRGTWEWFEPGVNPYIQDVLDDTPYVSGGGIIAFAIVFYTPNLETDTGYTNVISLEIGRSGDLSLVPPTGLAASVDYVTASVTEINLTWNDDPTVDGYHVYRDVNKDFLTMVKLTDGSPLTEPNFIDSSESLENPLLRAVMYYYKVSSVLSVSESSLSNFVDIFSPNRNWQLPNELGGFSVGADEYTVNWNWPGGTFPDSFRVYFSEEPDFNEDTWTYQRVSGVVDELIIDLTGRPETVYWRVVAYDRGTDKHGRMTDDLMGQTLNPWVWSDTETIGTGTKPISLIKVGGDYSVAYINGTNVDFSRRSGGTWTTETAMSDDTFGNFVAMSHGGGEYVIATQDFEAHDLYIATGTPGSWSGTRVHGDNSNAQGHPSSGNNVVVASSATEHVVVHALTAGESYAGSVMAVSKPNSGGSWSDATDLWEASFINDHLSMAEMDSNFYLLWQDPNADELMFSDKDGGWSQTNVLAAGVTGIGQYSALTRYAGEWWTPGYNSASGQRKIHFVHGTTAPWTEELHQDSGNVGEYASMAALDTKLFCVYFNRDADTWEFALYDGSSWVTNWLIIPGVSFSRAEAGGLGDTPYVVVDDSTSGNIIAVTGTPPV